jgi:phosphatidylglycerol:prolipoprotein diacylglycerol transferase
MFFPAITIGWDPLILDIGPTSIGWHGVMMLLGMVVATWLTGRVAPRAGIPSAFVYTTAFWIILFGLIGARLSHVLDNLDAYSSNPTQILAFWEGGLGWYGGLLGGLAAGIVCARVSKIPVGRFADAVAPAAMLGLSIGRIGCTINGDAYGTPTSLPWGLIYTHHDAYADLFVAGHPAPVYEIMWNLALFGVLWKLRGRLKPDGALFLAMIATYSFGRFLISWARAEDAVLGPLHQAHIISLILFAAAVALLVYWKAGWAKTRYAYEAATSDELAEALGAENPSVSESTDGHPQDDPVNISDQEQNREC